MRILGLVGLVLTLLIVGVALKKQLTVIAPSPPAAGATATPGPDPGNVRMQSQQIQQQIKQQLDAAMSQPRPMPDDN